MRKKDVFTSRAQMRKLIKSGRLAIEYRMLGVIIQPRALNEADHAEMEQLTALLMTYNELMTVPEKPAAAAHAANHMSGDKE